MAKSQKTKAKSGSRTKSAGRSVAAPARERAARPSVALTSRGKLERVRMPAASRASSTPVDKALTTDDSNEGKYVYCIIKSARQLRFGPLGIGSDPTEVQTVHYKDIAAVVSNTPMVVQDPTRDNVLAHQRVNETVMQQHTVIPMSFGTVFKTDDDIMELLRSAYDAFTDVLNKMAGKFEFGLKVLWDREQIISEIEE
jgi:hypothetical protein